VCRLYSLEFGCDFILLPWVAVWMVLECCKAEVSRLIKSENMGHYKGCLSKVKGSNRRTSDGTKAVHHPCTILWPGPKGLTDRHRTLPNLLTLKGEEIRRIDTRPTKKKSKEIQQIDIGRARNKGRYMIRRNEIRQITYQAS
jgi:hypothetical protein